MSFFCLSIGIGISGLAQNPAAGAANVLFYFIPSIMLSGTVAFISMPDWAKNHWLCLPLTYLVRLVKGIMLAAIQQRHCYLTSAADEPGGDCHGGCGIVEILS